MNDVPSAPIGDFENTLSFPSEETSLGRGGFSHISPWERFSPSHNWDTQYRNMHSCHHGDKDAYAETENIEFSGRII